MKRSHQNLHGSSCVNGSSRFACNLECFLFEDEKDKIPVIAGIFLVARHDLAKGTWRRGSHTLGKCCSEVNDALLKGMRSDERPALLG
jgi:hypothetical protein